MNCIACGKSLATSEAHGDRDAELCASCYLALSDEPNVNVSTLNVTAIHANQTIIFGEAWLCSLVFDAKELPVIVAAEAAKLPGVLMVNYSHSAQRDAVFMQIAYASMQTCDAGQDEREAWMRKFGII